MAAQGKSPCPRPQYANLQPPAPPVILHLMEAQTIAFDTYAFVKRLTGAGMPEDQAEVLAKEQSDLYERLVTKQYFEFTLKHELEKLRAELKSDIDKVQANLEQVKAELQHDIETVRAELKNDIETVRAELRNDIEKLRAELKHDIATVKAELRHELDEHKAANSQALKELELNLKHELRTVKIELKRDLKEMEQKLTIKLGAFLAISITVLAALIKFL